eukprot:g5880.t1
MAEESKGMEDVAATTTTTTSAAAGDASAAVEVPARPGRLMINRVEMENFKSYAGRRVIGPFHKSFSAVVGPNGSGKSNVIDAMLFVFGTRSNKLRMKKAAELIHRSAEHPNCEHARVTVYFADIVDVPAGEDVTTDHNGHTIVPGSEFRVSRTVDKDSKSTYHVDGKPMTFKEVAAILRTRGVDLDNHRFLILQGEVEQISLMPPKALKEGETGMLEYLEDITGSDAFKPGIAEAKSKEDVLTEERIEVVNRVKASEKDKDNLAGPRAEAEELLKKQRDLCELDANKSKVHLFKAGQKVAKAGAEEAKLAERAAKEQQRLEDKEKEAEELEARHAALGKEVKEIVKTMEKAQQDFTAFERKDIKHRADLKALKEKKKKLAKAEEKEQANEAKALKKAEKLEAALPELEAAIGEKQEALEAQRARLASIEEEKKAETAALRAEKDAKDEELAPWAQQTAEAKVAMDTTRAELALVEERATKARKQLQKDEAALANLGAKCKALLEAADKHEADVEDAVARLEEAKAAEEQLSAEVLPAGPLETAVRELRARHEDAAHAKQSVQAQGAAAQCLAKAARKGGRLQKAGFLGRLGDLAAIEEKYDVAVSTACGALNSFVTETAEGAMQCVEELKRSGAGRANFICLDKITYLAEHANKQIDTPDGVPRLFDLIQYRDAASEEKLRLAFFFGLRNTLVAEDIDQATGLAYVGDQARWRVVTLDGKLIETTGTMAGGGKPRSGLMGTRIGGGGAAGGGGSTGDDGGAGLMSDEELLALGREVEAAERALSQARRKLLEAQAAVKDLAKAVKRGTKEAAKKRMEHDATVASQPDLEARVAVLKGECDLSPEDAARAEELKSTLALNERAYEKAKAQSDEVEAEVAALTKRIMEAGGPALKKQKEAVKTCQIEVKQAEKAVAKAKVDVKAATRDAGKAKTAAAKAAKDLTAAEAKQEKLVAEFKQIEDDALSVIQSIDAVKKERKHKEAELSDLAKELEEVSAVAQKMKVIAVDIADNLAAIREALKANEEKVEFWSAKIKEQAKQYKDLTAELIEALPDDAKKKKKKAGTADDEEDKEDEASQKKKKKTTKKKAAGGDVDMEDAEEEEEVDDDEEDELVHFSSPSKLDNVLLLVMRGSGTTEQLCACL